MSMNVVGSRFTHTTQVKASNNQRSGWRAEEADLQKLGKRVLQQNKRQHNLIKWWGIGISNTAQLNNLLTRPAVVKGQARLAEVRNAFKQEYFRLLKISQENNTEMSPEAQEMLLTKINSPSWLS